MGNELTTVKPAADKKVEPFLKDQLEATKLARGIVDAEKPSYNARYDAVYLELRRCEINCTGSTTEQVITNARLIEAYLKG